MGKMSLKQSGGFLLRLVLVTFFAVLISNVVVLVAKLLTSTVSGKWATVIVAALSFVFAYWAFAFRPGEEKFSEFIMLLATVGVVGAFSVALGWSFFNYVTDVATAAGIVLTAATLFLSDVGYLKIKKSI